MFFCFCEVFSWFHEMYRDYVPSYTKFSRILKWCRKFKFWLMRVEKLPKRKCMKIYENLLIFKVFGDTRSKIAVPSGIWKSSARRGKFARARAQVAEWKAGRSGEFEKAAAAVPAARLHREGRKGSEKKAARITGRQIPPPSGAAKKICGTLKVLEKKEDSKNRNWTWVHGERLYVLERREGQRG